MPREKKRHKDHRSTKERAAFLRRKILMTEIYYKEDDSYTTGDIFDGEVNEELATPMDNLRYWTTVVHGMPFRDDEETVAWDSRRRTVDAYGADILGTVAVADVTGSSELLPEDFEETTENYHMLAYYRSLSEAQRRLQNPEQISSHSRLKRVTGLLLSLVLR